MKTKCLFMMTLGVSLILLGSVLTSDLFAACNSEEDARFVIDQTVESTVDDVEVQDVCVNTTVHFKSTATSWGEVSEDPPAADGESIAISNIFTTVGHEGTWAERDSTVGKDEIFEDDIDFTQAGAYVVTSMLAGVDWDPDNDDLCAYPATQAINVVDLGVFSLSDTNCADGGSAADSTLEDEARESDPYAATQLISLMQKYTYSSVVLNMNLTWEPMGVAYSKMKYRIWDEGTSILSGDWTLDEGPFDSDGNATSTWNPSADRKFDIRAYFNCDEQTGDDPHDYPEDKNIRKLYADVAYFEGIKVTSGGGTTLLTGDEEWTAQKEIKAPENRIMMWHDGSTGDEFEGVGVHDKKKHMITLTMRDQGHECVKEVVRICTTCKCASCDLGSIISVKTGSADIIVNLGKAALWFSADIGADGGLTGLRNFI